MTTLFADIDAKHGGGEPQREQMRELVEQALSCDGITGARVDIIANDMNGRIQVVFSNPAQEEAARALLGRVQGLERVQGAGENGEGEDVGAIHFQGIADAPPEEAQATETQE
ncbi:hypothetical protein COU80_01670 [Candidatus Peregrinibacteria bacterium CG10_big_fil_rev_8_21_14_0_10_55_24]|nr:MAG: hypothetical protein COU80_01670 [Candidatus Peregrinibacteria bacterium CG10_big_fil_rev_8_21_14_0_10_55_24]